MGTLFARRRMGRKRRDNGEENAEERTHAGRETTASRCSRPCFNARVDEPGVDEAAYEKFEEVDDQAACALFRGRLGALSALGFFGRAGIGQPRIFSSASFKRIKKTFILSMSSSSSFP